MASSRQSSALRGTAIFILPQGIRQPEVLDMLAFIRRHGGITVSDPHAPMITHILVRTPPNTPLDKVPITNRRAGLWDKDHWSLDTILHEFTTNNGKSNDNNVPVIVVDTAWLQASVDAGHALGAQDSYGNLLVKGSLDPRLRPSIGSPASSFLDRADDGNMWSPADDRTRRIAARPPSPDSSRQWDNYHRRRDVDDRDRAWDRRHSDRGRHTDNNYRPRSRSRSRSPPGRWVAPRREQGWHGPAIARNPSSNRVDQAKARDDSKSSTPPQNPPSNSGSTAPQGSGRIPLSQRLHAQSSMESALETNDQSVIRPSSAQSGATVSEVPLELRLGAASIDKLSNNSPNGSAQPPATPTLEQRLSHSAQSVSLEQRLSRPSMDEHIESNAISSRALESRLSDRIAIITGSETATNSVPAPVSEANSVNPVINTTQSPAVIKDGSISAARKRKAEIHIKIEPLDPKDIPSPQRSPPEMQAKPKRQKQANTENMRSANSRMGPKQNAYTNNQSGVPSTETPAKSFPAHGSAHLDESSDMDLDSPLAATPAPSRASIPHPSTTHTARHGSLPQSSVPVTIASPVNDPVAPSQAPLTAVSAPHLPPVQAAVAAPQAPPMQTLVVVQETLHHQAVASPQPVSHCPSMPSTLPVSNPNGTSLSSPAQAHTPTVSSQKAPTLDDFARAIQQFPEMPMLSPPRSTSLSLPPAPMTGTQMPVQPPPHVYHPAPTPAAPPALPAPPKPTGIFADGQTHPLSFHVVGSMNTPLETLITGSGGELVPIQEAQFVILPLDKDVPPTEPKHCELAAKIGVHPCARIISRMWAIQCLVLEGKLLDPDPYVVKPVPFKRVEPPPSQTPAPRPRFSSSSSSLNRTPAVQHSQTPVVRPTSQLSTSKHVSQSPLSELRSAGNDSDSDDSDWDELDEEEETEQPEEPSSSLGTEEADIRPQDEHTVKRLVHELRNWNQEGGKYNFLQSLSQAALIPNSRTIYRRYAKYIDAQVPGLSKFKRRGRPPKD